MDDPRCSHPRGIGFREGPRRRDRGSSVPCHLLCSYRVDDRCRLAAKHGDGACADARWLPVDRHIGRIGALRWRPIHRFYTANTEALKSDRIIALYEDRAGQLWIGTEHGGVTRYSQGTWTTYTTKDHLPYDSVPSLFEDPAGTMWVATTNGLARYHEGGFTPVTELGGLRLNNLMRGYWDREGTLWLGFWGGGLVSLRDGVLTVHHPLVDRQPDNWVRVITPAHDGSLYIGTRKGLLRFGGGKMTKYTTQDGLSSNEIECVLEDQTGTIWVGTQGGGLNRFTHGRWTVYNPSSGVGDDYIRSLLSDREGNLWVGTNTEHRAAEPVMA